MKEGNNIVVFAECYQNSPLEHTYELLSEAHRLAEKMQYRVVTAVLGGSAMAQKKEELAVSFAEYGADEVAFVFGEALEQYTTEAFATGLCDILTACKAEAVLFGGTLLGRDLAPRCAAKLRAGLTTDVTRLDLFNEEYEAFLTGETKMKEADIKALSMEEGALKMTKPAFGGKMFATITSNHVLPQMATIRPGTFRKERLGAVRTAEVREIAFSGLAETANCRVIKSLPLAKKKVDLAHAEIIVAGGRGMGSEKGVELLKAFAEKTGGVIATTRAAVDAGWLGHEYQVGQTGEIVAPRIFFAFGISGSVQFTEGMKNSDVIIAVNTDPSAPIFEIADYGIVGDLYEVIPEFLEQWETALQ